MRGLRQTVERVARAAVLLLLLSAGVASSGGGLTFDGAADFLDCGVVNFDATADYWNIAAYVRPNFADTEVTTKTILDNNNFAGNQGYALQWRGDLSPRRFRATGGGTAFNRICDVSITGTTTFAAGDVLGLYFSIANNVQNCEMVNLSNAAGGGAGTSTDGINMANSANNLTIGANVAQTGTFWDGDIFMIVMTNNRIKNDNNNQLVSAMKKQFLYLWPGNPPTQSYTFIDWIASWDFQSGNRGTSPATVIDLSGNGHTCTVNGAPVATDSPLIN